jgi:ADP-dependent NAD(P)H-hydrate dehydratase
VTAHRRGRRKSADPKPLDRKLLRSWPLPELPPNSDKEARGTVLVVGGSCDVPGAVLLAGIAALRAGAGRLQIGVARSVAVAVGVACPEARVIALPQTRRGELGRAASSSLNADLQRCQALVIGPGMRQEAAVAPLLRLALAHPEGPTVVLDAAALRVLKRPSERLALERVIATPHAGEMAELWECTRDQVEANPLELAREAAQALGLTLVLKGTRTVIATAAGVTFVSTNGNPGLGTSGSGDILAGLIAGLAARGASSVQAAAWAVYLHGAAGDHLARHQGPLGYLARELSAEVPRLLARLGRVP